MLSRAQRAPIRNNAELKDRLREFVQIRETEKGCELVFVLGKVRISPLHGVSTNVAWRNEAVIRGMIEEFVKEFVEHREGYRDTYLADEEESCS